MHVTQLTGGIATAGDTIDGALGDVPGDVSGVLSTLTAVDAATRAAGECPTLAARDGSPIVTVRNGDGRRGDESGEPRRARGTSGTPAERSSDVCTAAS